MYFRSLDEEIPSRGEMVLIKVKDNPITDCYIRYYICHAIYKNDDGSDIMFEEAGGEQFMYWQSFEVSGWMPIADLDQIDSKKTYIQDFKEELPCGHMQCQSCWEMIME